MPNWEGRASTQLTSSKNPQVQAVRKAVKSGRATEDGLIVIEGPHLLEEAYGSSWRVERVFTTAAGLDRYAGLFRGTEAEVIQLPPGIFDSICTTETPQDIVGLVHPRSWSWEDISRSPSLMVVLDRIQDPGNAGTVIRSAEAFGASGVVFLSGSARISNPKLLRATAGSIFRIPFLEGIEPSEVAGRLAQSKAALFALNAQGKNCVSEVDFRQSCAIIAGNEGSGISEEFRTIARQISIRTFRVESLNAAVACSVALYEASRQRARARK
jgi:TrmH family RNA methyltransferase